MPKGFEVITRPGGYEAWRDDTPIRRTNTKAIMAAVGFMLFVCGSFSGVTGLILGASNQEPEEMITLIPSMTVESISGSIPEYTPAITATNTDEPTVSPEATQEILPSDTVTPIPSIAPSLTITPTPIPISATSTPTPIIERVVITSPPQRIRVISTVIVTSPPQQVEVVVTSPPRQITREVIVTSPPQVVTATSTPTYTSTPTATGTPTATVSSTSTIEQTLLPTVAAPTEVNPESTQESEP